MIFFAIFGKRMNCDEMDGNRPRLSANRNCCRLSRVSLDQILKIHLPAICLFIFINILKVFCLFVLFIQFIDQHKYTSHML